MQAPITLYLTEKHWLALRAFVECDRVAHGLGDGTLSVAAAAIADPLDWLSDQAPELFDVLRLVAGAEL